MTKTKTHWLFPLQLVTREYLKNYFEAAKLTSQTINGDTITETFDVYMSGYKRWFSNHVLIVYKRGKRRNTYQLYTQQDCSPVYPSLN